MNKNNCGAGKVGVIGAGVMGCDLALAIAARKIDIVVFDKEIDALKKAKRIILDSYKLLKFSQKCSLLEGFEEIYNRIRFSSEIECCFSSEIVIENVTEEYAEKKEVHLQLDKADDISVVAINTSCIPIKAIAEDIEHKDRMVGAHFMNPAYIKSMVEIIRSEHTSDDTIFEIKKFLKKIGKKGIVVNDSPGFVTNRIMMLMINEAINVVSEDVADVKSVDQIFMRGFSHHMGPLATADLIGLDTIQKSLMVLFDFYKDNKYRPAKMLKKMVAEGNLGRKTGSGFYSY